MRTVAFLMRYGHQDFYRLVGRDPTKFPLTPIEREVLAACLLEHFEAEVRPLPGVPTGED